MERPLRVREPTASPLVETERVKEPEHQPRLGVALFPAALLVIVFLAFVAIAWTIVAAGSAAA